MFLPNRKSIGSAVAALLCALAVSIGSLCAYAQTCDDVRSEVLRLHVRANSDSDADQNIKLLVRDRILETGALVFGDAKNAEEAAAAVRAAADRLTCIANEVLAAQNAGYGARVSVKKEYFDTRVYEDITLPAGVYLAVCIDLGEAAGRNWWCVMFPPLCLPAVTKTDAADTILLENGHETVVQAKDGYVIRFKIVELFEEWKQKYFS